MLKLLKVLRIHDTHIYGRTYSISRRNSHNLPLIILSNTRGKTHPTIQKTIGAENSATDNLNPVRGLARATWEHKNMMSALKLLGSLEIDHETMKEHTKETEATVSKSKILSLPAFAQQTQHLLRKKQVD